MCLFSRLADLMEQHQEELATIETIDSGAVYTLALKTHIGMSIQTFRYFAGWCDKIQVCLLFIRIFIYQPSFVMYASVIFRIFCYIRILEYSVSIHSVFFQALFTLFKHF